MIPPQTPSKFLIRGNNPSEAGGNGGFLIGE